MKRIVCHSLVSLLFVAPGFISAHAKSHNPKVAKDAGEAEIQASVPVIIQYNDMPNKMDMLNLGMRGGSVKQKFSSIPAIAASLPGSAIERLAADPSVKYVSIDRKVASRASWYSAEPVNAPYLWSAGVDGSGVGVAVIDSGIDSSAVDLGPVSRVIYQHNFVQDQNQGLLGQIGNVISGTKDQYGHGTHVAGIIGGNGADSTGKHYFRTFSGIAPNANLIDLQVLDQNGEGTDSTVIAAIETAIALRDVLNIRVINLSLGRPVFESYQKDPLCQAAERAWKAGILVVVAAGNDGRFHGFNDEGYGTINAPGNDPYVLTVGSANTNGTPGIQDDTLASYSSKGPSLVDDIAKPDLLAPGSRVVSVRNSQSSLVKNNPNLFTPWGDYRSNGNQTKASSDYFPLSGTSMAAAVTSGAAALMFEAQPQLTPDQVKALFMRDASKTNFPQISYVTDTATNTTYTSYYDLLSIGAGYLDIEASFKDAQANGNKLPAGYALSPTTALDPSGTSIDLQFDQQSLWTANASWAPAKIYGGQAFVPTDSGATIIWGRSTIYGSTIIWGRTSVTGSTIIWGRSSTLPAGALAPVTASQPSQLQY